MSVRAYGPYSLVASLLGGGFQIRRQDADDRKRTVASVDSIAGWDGFIAALKNGASEVDAVHAIDAAEEGSAMSEARERTKAQGPPIRLTLVSNHMRSEPVEFDTDDLGEALAEYGRRHFGSGDNAGPETWIVAFVVEQGDARMPRGKQAESFRDIASIEQYRAHREAERP